MPERWETLRILRDAPARPLPVPVRFEPTDRSPGRSPVHPQRTDMVGPDLGWPALERIREGSSPAFLSIFWVTRQPRLFVAFAHNERAERVARFLRGSLGQLGVKVYRAMDHPHPGESIPARIIAAIEWADAIVILWSDRAGRSEVVRWEYDEDIARGTKTCLVKFPRVEPPEDWPPVSSSCLFPESHSPRGSQG